MRRLFYWLCFAIVPLLASSALGQSLPPAHKATPPARYCQPGGGFCFRYPASWSMLGDVFDGNGVVIAPAQKSDRALWDEITIATVAPPPQDGQASPGLDGIIQRASDAMRAAGHDFQTLQRQQRTVDGKPAEVLKTKYRDQASGQDWIEELVFIEGPDGEIYSVALKCSTANLPRREPVLAEVLRTWRLAEPAVDSRGPEESVPPATAPPTPKAQP